MITITSITTNGNFEWSNEILQGNGNFVKNDEGKIIQLYFNGSYKTGSQSQCQLNANRNGETFFFNINFKIINLPNFPRWKKQEIQH